MPVLCLVITTWGSVTSAFLPFDDLGLCSQFLEIILTCEALSFDVRDVYLLDSCPPFTSLPLPFLRNDPQLVRHK